MDGDQILTRSQAAEYLKKKGEVYAISPAGLAKLACIGGGPKMLKVGRRVGYQTSTLDEWSDSRTKVVSSTSEL